VLFLFQLFFNLKRKILVDEVEISWVSLSSSTFHLPSSESTMVEKDVALPVYSLCFTIHKEPQPILRTFEKVT
jgi:hypothetical protein